MLDMLDGYKEWLFYGYMITGSVVALFALLYSWGILGKKNRDFSYVPAGWLFTATEKRFLFALERAMDSDKFVIYGKVRIADIIKPSKGLNRKTWNKNFWRTTSKHIDFVVTDRKNRVPLCLIELNDSTHERRDRRERDEAVTRMMESADIPLFWISTGWHAGNIDWLAGKCLHILDASHATKQREGLIAL